MLKKELVFVFEGENDAMAINLNNFFALNFVDAKREIVVDYGTTERTVTIDNDNDYFNIKDQMLTAVAGE
jgi:hypothetical protein